VYIQGKNKPGAPEQTNFLESGDIGIKSWSQMLFPESVEKSAKDERTSTS